MRRLHHFEEFNRKIESAVGPFCLNANDDKPVTISDCDPFVQDQVT